MSWKQITDEMFARESYDYSGEKYLANNNKNETVQLCKTVYGNATFWQTCAQVCTDGCGTEYIEDKTHQSTTAMGNKINAEIHPYIVLPTNNHNDVMIGDLGIVIDLKTNRSCYVIYAERGPAGKIGEMSVRVFQKLGLDIGNKYNLSGYDEKRFVTIMLPGSRTKFGYGEGNRIPKYPEDIQTNGAKLIGEFLQARDQYLKNNRA